MRLLSGETCTMKVTPVGWADDTANGAINPATIGTSHRSLSIINLVASVDVASR